MSDHDDQNRSETPVKQSGPDWEDPSIPVGNAPPMPGWPLVAAIVAWTGGIIFLLVMMSERIG